MRGTIYFPGGVSVLAFVDWPERIGIDNLALDTQSSGRCLPDQVPEPSTLPTLGLGLALLAVVRRVAAKKPARSWL